MEMKLLSIIPALTLVWSVQTHRFLAQKTLQPLGVLLEQPANLPLVIWHGLGDKYNSDGIKSVGELLNKTIGPTFTYNVRLDEDPSADRTATFLGNLTLQIKQVCEDIASHPILAKASAINALGFSQGGQFLRAYVERCNKPPVANLVTFGSQHNGISEFQKCAPDNWVCQGWDGVLKANTWSEFVQSRLVPAQYFRNLDDIDNYLESSNFLADINNERDVKNSTYKTNMKQLKKFAMYMFSNDTTVVPKESAYFYDVNTTSEKITKLQDRKMYQEDWLGLKWLDQQARLDLKVIPGGHMQFSDQTLKDVFSLYFQGHGRKDVNLSLA